MLRPALALGLLLFVPAVRADDAETFFETKIRPVLAETCLQCHGGDKVSGGLRVDSREALLKGGEHGPALIPGLADRRLLTRALRYIPDSDLKMPPDKKLPAAVVEDFVTWVNAGAVLPKPVGLPA